MTQDRILLQGMQFYASHGNNSEERALGQPFQVDMEVEIDLQQAGVSDSLRDTVSYSHLFETVREVVEGPPKNLLEAVAVTITSRVMERFSPVTGVRVKVVKHRPPIRGSVLANASVEVYRERN